MAPSELTQLRADIAELKGLLIGVLGADKTMDAKEAATYLGCSIATVRRRARAGVYKNLSPANKPMRFRQADLLSQKDGGRPMSGISLLG